MNDLWIRIATPIAIEVLTMMLMSLATVATGIFTQWLYRWTGYQADSAQAAKLEHAIRNGLSFAGEFVKGSLMDAAKQRSVMTELTAQYVEQFNPDTLKHFKMDHEALKRRITPHLPD